MEDLVISILPVRGGTQSLEQKRAVHQSYISLEKRVVELLQRLLDMAGNSQILHQAHHW